MAEQILPITGLDQAGVILDTPPVALPPQAMSDARNVRFRDGAISKMEGEINIFPGVFNPETEIVKYTAWWPNPNLADNNSGYYLVIVENSTDEEDIAYLLLPDASDTDDKVEKGRFSVDTQAAWQHTFFQGGFALVINNGLDEPHYILDGDGNEDIDDVPDFAILPGWDSYNVNEILIEDTFQAGDSSIFSLGQQVDTEVYGITVYQNDTELDEEDDFVISYGTFTEITFNTAPTAGDVIRIEITSLNPVNTVAGVIRSFGDILVAGNLREVDSLTPTRTVRNLPGVVRTSDVALPGNIPTNWSPFAAGVSTADEFVVSDTGIVQDMVALQGALYIYSNQSISIMRSTGNSSVPFSITNVTDSYGAQTTDSVIEYDGRHFVVGSQDIYIFGGHPGSIQSVGDARVRRYLFDRLNPLHEARMFVRRYQQRDEIWICYPTTNSVVGELDQALVWNYRANNWTIRDLDNVVSGDVGPVPGGGIPNSNFTLSGSSGNNVQLDPGVVEIQRFTSQSWTPLSLPSDTEQIFSIRVDVPAFTATGPEEWTFEIGDMFATQDASMHPVGFVFTQQLNGTNIHQFRVALDTDLVRTPSNGAEIRTYILDTLNADDNFVDFGYETSFDTQNDDIFFITHTDTETEYDSISIDINADVTNEADSTQLVETLTHTSDSSGIINPYIDESNIGNAVFVNVDDGYEL